MRRWATAALAAGLVWFGALPARAASYGPERVSLTGSGGQSNESSSVSSISEDGRYVVFSSNASNLVTGDTNGLKDVFVRDRTNGTTRRVSVSSTGVQGNGTSWDGGISADGRFVAFDSYASNLVAGDTNGFPDVFVHDLQTGQTIRVSVSTGGVQGDKESGTSGASPVAVSADGRYVAFESDASNLVAGDTNGSPDVFVHDLRTRETTRVSVSGGGAQGDAASRQASMSKDGRYVAFESDASNLVTGDGNGVGDVFVHDRQTGQTTRVSVSSAGDEGDGKSIGEAALSADGRYVSFCSEASNLVAGDTNGYADVFVHDRQTGQTVRVSVSSMGVQGDLGAPDLPTSISADGRFVTFGSLSTNLILGEVNTRRNVFVHDLRTGATARVSMTDDATQGNADSWPRAVSADGRHVVFDSDASNLVTGDTNGFRDAFLAANPLFPVARAAGADRYETAAAISRSAFPFGAGTVFVATGSGFPDALGAGPAAAWSDAPLLLVTKDRIPSSTAAELTRLKPAEIVIVGGTGVVSAWVEYRLGSYAASVRRLAGADRYGTAVAISKDAFPSGAGTVFVATGADFPDALGAGPAAAWSGGPLLLVTRDRIPSSTAAELSRLKPAEVVVVGGTGVVSDAVESQLGTYAGTVRRLAGADRYGTAVAISRDAFPGTAGIVMGATGVDFPDALGAGPVAALVGAPLLLVEKDRIPSTTGAELSRLQPLDIVIVGGSGVVSDGVLAGLVAYVQ